MGLTALIQALLGANTSGLKELAEVFRVNAEAADARGGDFDTAALQQFAAEFVARSQRTWWDSLVDGLNRLPRPLITLGVIFIFVWSWVDPTAMAEVFAAWAIIPTPVWALITVVITFFFGGRAQVKAQDFQRDMAGVVAGTQAFIAQRKTLRALDDPPVAETPPTELLEIDDNPALDAWRASMAN